MQPLVAPAWKPGKVCRVLQGVLCRVLAQPMPMLPLLTRARYDTSILRNLTPLRRRGHDMARTRIKALGRKDAGTFLMIPTAVINSANFRALSAKAKALILDMGAGYNGHNNGDIAAPYSWMKERGWRSKDTLQRALVELRWRGMIEQTRQGGLVGASLYAFTWLSIDHCKGKLDVPATQVASGKWKHVPAPILARIKIATPTIGASYPDHRASNGENIATLPRSSGP